MIKDLKQHAFTEYQYSVAHSNQLIALTESITKNFPITHVWVSHYYFDGRYLDISTDMEWKKKMSEYAWYNHFVQSFFDNYQYESKNQANFLMWGIPQDQNSMLLSSIKNICNILSGFNIFFVRDHFIENFGFASPCEVNQLSGLIAPFYETFKKFTFSLSMHMSPSFSQTTSQYGMLDQKFTCHRLCPPLLKVELPKKISIRLQYQDVILTARELECLLFIAQGMPYKTIASIMKISTKTIEFFLSRIKLKTHLSIKEQLIPILKEQGIINWAKP